MIQVDTFCIYFRSVTIFSKPIYFLADHVKATFTCGNVYCTVT